MARKATRVQMMFTLSDEAITEEITKRRRTAIVLATRARKQVRDIETLVGHMAMRAFTEHKMGRTTKEQHAEIVANNKARFDAFGTALQRLAWIERDLWTIK